MPIHGTSMAYTFDQPRAPTRKRTQYFETAGHRAIWHEGWKAVAYHDPATDFEADQWELYHLDEDFSNGRILRWSTRRSSGSWWSDGG